MSDDPSCALTRTLSTVSSPILPVDSTWDTPIIDENTESVLFSPSPTADIHQKDTPSKLSPNDLLFPKSSTDSHLNTRLQIGRAHV